MHNVSTGASTDTSPAAVVYRERLSPSLWAFVSGAVAAPMAALVFAPIDATASLVAGIVVGVGIIAALLTASPTVTVSDDELRVGVAHIDVGYLGDAEALTGEEARQARGPALTRESWHLLRGSIDGIVRVEIRDADDPVRTWVFASRTPDRVVAAIRRAQAAR